MIQLLVRWQGCNMEQAILSGHVLLFNGNKVLLVRHGEGAGHLTGVYGIPGGRPDEGEDIIDAASRELFEETGITVSNKDLISFPDNQYSANIKRKDGSIKKYTMTVFIGKEFSGEPKASEETSPEWIETSKLNSYNLLPNVAKAVSDGVKFLKYG